jgi:hypothetical protein
MGPSLASPTAINNSCFSSDLQAILVSVSFYYAILYDAECAPCFLTFAEQIEAEWPGKAATYLNYIHDVIKT